MHQNNQPIPPKEVSLKEIINKIWNSFLFLISKWKSIAIVGIIGSCIGILLSYFMPVKFISRIEFLVEESKSGMGGLASLAGQFGIDLNSASGGGGILSGDNVLIFLKSEQLCRETLATTYDDSTTLADKYAEARGWKKKWLKKENVGEINFFRFSELDYPRLEDSLMQVIVKEVLTKDLIIDKPDKKSTFVEVKAIMRDEMLSKLFCDRLVEIATKKYLDAKLKIKLINIKKLQKRADSLASILDNKTFNAANFQQELIDINPALRSATIESEIAVRDKTMIATIFTEVVKNLEVSKTVLSHETPIIEIVDRSSYPLERRELKKTIATIIGFGLFSFLYILVLLFRRYIYK
jgi:hypothetical protein